MNKSDIIKAAEEAAGWLQNEPCTPTPEQFTKHLAKLKPLRLCAALIAAAELLKQVEVVELFPKGKWLPIEKGYYDAEVYLCYFPENKGVEKYKTHGLLSIAKTKGATHYIIPQPPEETPCSK